MNLFRPDFTAILCSKDLPFLKSYVLVTVSEHESAEMPQCHQTEYRVDNEHKKLWPTEADPENFENLDPGAKDEVRIESFLSRL